MSDSVSNAIRESFITDDSQGLTDIVESLATNTRRIANAITQLDASPGPCPSGDGHVGSLTEAVMGLTRAMMQIATAIESVAISIENH